MIKFKCIALITILLILFSGCSEPYSTYSATLINNTGTDMKILPYRNGIVKVSDTLYLSKDAELAISGGWHPGAVKVPFFISDIFVEDSLEIIFNEHYRSVHYRIDPETISEKAIIFSSLRNITNIANYDFKSKGSKRRGYNNEHFFTFTESDYEFAKE